MPTTCPQAAKRNRTSDLHTIIGHGLKAKREMLARGAKPVTAAYLCQCGEWHLTTQGDTRGQTVITIQGLDIRHNGRNAAQVKAQLSAMIATINGR